MTNTFDCLIVNDLPEISFIGGAEQTLEFNIYDDNGLPINVVGSVCSWRLSPYGNAGYTTLSILGVTSGSQASKYTVTVSGSNTLSLEGKYIQQPKIIDIAGVEYRPSQGIVTIIPRIT
jgi:hypothetical protein